MHALYIAQFARSLIQVGVGMRTVTEQLNSSDIWHVHVNISKNYKRSESDAAMHRFLRRIYGFNRAVLGY